MFSSERIELLAPHLQWRTNTIGPGNSVRGWIAGPLQVVSVHFVNKASRPCRSKITSGKLLCYCAATPISVRQLAYLPLITQAREKVVVLMCATTARKASILAVTQEVEFWRPQRAKAPLAIKILVPGELGTSPFTEVIKKKPHDIREYLLRVLWQDLDLINYFDKLETASEPKCATPAGEIPKYPPLVRRSKARDNTVSLPKLTEGIGLDPNKA